MAATTSPLPTPPFVDVPGLPNFRDCGGYPVTNTNTSGEKGDGRPHKIIRRGVLFRSSEPSLLTDDGIAILRDTLRITHVFDLRSLPEIERDAKLDGRQPREWDGAQRVFAPVFLDEDYSPEAVARRYAHFSNAEGEVSFALSLLSRESKGFRTRLRPHPQERHRPQRRTTLRGRPAAPRLGIAAPHADPDALHRRQGQDRRPVRARAVFVWRAR